MGKIKNIVVGTVVLATAASAAAIIIPAVLNNAEKTTDNDSGNGNYQPPIVNNEGYYNACLAVADTAERAKGKALVNNATQIYSMKIEDNYNFVVYSGVTVNNIKQSHLNIELTYNVDEAFTTYFNSFKNETNLAKIDVDGINNAFNYFANHMKFENLKDAQVIDVIKDDNVKKVVNNIVLNYNNTNNSNEKTPLSYSPSSTTDLGTGASFWQLSMNDETRAYQYQCVGTEYIDNKEITYTTIIETKDPTPSSTALTTALVNASNNGEITVTYKDIDVLNYTLHQNAVNKNKTSDNEVEM